ncbi:MAG: copper chaperone NosL [Thermodesulfobacteriota bacterium]|nr:copper chaperone NosL [Thermodesulfobacteriota bacterium]
MKKGVLFVALFSFFLSMTGAVLGADDAQEDIRKEPTCKYCGMDRGKFAHSRMLVIYDDGSELGTCSIHCLAIDLALNIDKTPSSVQVGDFNTKKLIDAETAFWVIGGNKPGVMTKQAKWAFGSKEDAEKFIMLNGGTLATFNETMKAAYESMYADTKMIRDKRKMMKMKGPAHK